MSQEEVFCLAEPQHFGVSSLLCETGSEGVFGDPPNPMADSSSPSRLWAMSRIPNLPPFRRFRPSWMLMAINRCYHETAIRCEIHPMQPSDSLAIFHFLRCSISRSAVICDIILGGCRAELVGL